MGGEGLPIVQPLHGEDGDGVRDEWAGDLRQALMGRRASASRR